MVYNMMVLCLKNVILVTLVTSGVILSRVAAEADHPLLWDHMDDISQC